jgi:hypothetical protein
VGGGARGGAADRDAVSWWHSCNVSVNLRAARRQQRVCQPMHCSAGCCRKVEACLREGSLQRAQRRRMHSRGPPRRACPTPWPWLPENLPLPPWPQSEDGSKTVLVEWGREGDEFDSQQQVRRQRPRPGQPPPQPVLLPAKAPPYCCRSCTVQWG